AGNTVASSQEEKRAGAAGRSYAFSSSDGATRYSLLLLREDDRLYGLYAQGASPLFEKHRGVLEEMARSFTLERLADYPVRREEEFGFSVRLPPSWRQTRRFSGGETLLMQYTSPAPAAGTEPPPPPARAADPALLGRRTPPHAVHEPGPRGRQEPPDRPRRAHAHGGAGGGGLDARELLRRHAEE